MSNGAQLIDQALSNMSDVMSKKRDDYSSNEDWLSNFRESSQIAGVQLEQSILVYIGTKLSRIKNLMNNGSEAQNESLQDSALDLANYATILYAHLSDQPRKPTPEARKPQPRPTSV